jgi:hypothetical protein
MCGLGVRLLELPRAMPPGAVVVRVTGEPARSKEGHVKGRLALGCDPRGPICVMEKNSDRRSEMAKQAQVAGAWLIWDKTQAALGGMGNPYPSKESAEQHLAGRGAKRGIAIEGHEYVIVEVK